jgi:hypothetical protein
MNNEHRELIRKRRKKRIESDVAFLKKAARKAPAGDPSDEEIAEIYAGIRRRRRDLRTDAERSGN